jgi:hypothetical protein
LFPEDAAARPWPKKPFNSEAYFKSPELRKPHSRQYDAVRSPIAAIKLRPLCPPIIDERARTEDGKA